MRLFDRTLQIIRLDNDRNRLILIASALALLAAIVGVIVGRSTAPSDVTVAADVDAHEVDEEHGPEGFVPITAAQLEASGIAVEKVQSGSLAHEILAQATVTAPPTGQAILTARADGAVVRINKRLGDPVGAGETVALLESRDAAAFVAERNAAAARERAAHAAWLREERLYREQVTAREALEAARAAHDATEVELQRAETALRAAGVTGGRYLAVRSPISGRITDVDTQLGAYVQAGAELFDVANENSIQIEAAVPAPEAQRLQPGDRAFVELPQGGIVEAAVRSITPSLDPQSRAATVVLQLNGAPGGLRQGQAVRVRITPRASTATGIILPEEAVQQVEGRDVVFVQVPGGFQAMPVSVGSRSGGRVEILDGLQPGQVVVTEGAFVLKSQLGASEAEH